MEAGIGFSGGVGSQREKMESMVLVPPFSMSWESDDRMSIAVGSVNGLP